MSSNEPPTGTHDTSARVASCDGFGPQLGPVFRELYRFGFKVKTGLRAKPTRLTSLRKDSLKMPDSVTDTRQRAKSTVGE